MLYSTTSALYLQFTAKARGGKDAKAKLPARKARPETKAKAEAVKVAEDEDSCLDIPIGRMSREDAQLVLKHPNVKSKFQGYAMEAIRVRCSDG